MDSGIKYYVRLDSDSDPIGYFLDREYYEPVSSLQPVGRLDDNDNFTYDYITINNPHGGQVGTFDGSVLIRIFDGLAFRITRDPASS